MYNHKWRIMAKGQKEGNGSIHTVFLRSRKLGLKPVYIRIGFIMKRNTAYKLGGITHPNHSWIIMDTPGANRHRVIVKSDIFHFGGTENNKLVR